MNFENILTKHKNFIGKNSQVFFSPGRVNLIGEHIDYLGGNVFPTAINLGTYGFVTKRDDNEFHFLSHNFPESGEKVASLADLDYKEERNWANYPVGVVKHMINKGYEIPHGLNVLIYGTLPNGAGLSSSASLEVLMGVILRDTFDLDISMLDIVKLSQDVENNYVGVNCGIMDQFAVGMSKKDKAIYLNTNTLDYELVPLELGDYTLVIANTNKKRALADSKYNERRSECDLALRVIQRQNITIEHLCDLTADEFEKLGNIFPNETIKVRAEHAVKENDRTKKAVECLNNGNLEKFGKLMDLSHDSLKNLYKVSCKELDTLVDCFRKFGAIGSRMTGAGFGGCTISLVKTADVEKVINKVRKEYKEKIGYDADFYPCKTNDGARKLLEEDLV